MEKNDPERGVGGGKRDIEEGTKDKQLKNHLNSEEKGEKEKKVGEKDAREPAVQVPVEEQLGAERTRAGGFRRPANVPLDVFIDELHFYELVEQIMACFEEDEDFPKESHPESLSGESIIAITSVMVIVVPILIFCLEMLPDFRSENESRWGGASVFQDTFFLVETMCVCWLSFELLMRFACLPSQMHFFKDVMNIIDFTTILPY
ncbi:unnamed protein product [Coregonus sp. 'balchen']|nr:unnamed protein product [Coregonus sp. 'balchen']